MLTSENASPSKLAYDRPSPKLIKFLQKHFGLASYVPQNNNFVVFNEYFKVELLHQPTHSPGEHRDNHRIQKIPSPITQKKEEPYRPTFASPQASYERLDHRGFMDLGKKQMNNTAPLKHELGEEFNKFQSNANTLLRFQGQFKDVYHQRGREVYNPKHEKRIEELE